jgi:hypothetical protein
MTDINFNTVLQKTLKDVPEEFLECRDLRHKWSVVDDFHVVEEAAEGRYVQRRMHCIRCTTIKTEKYLLKMDRWGITRLESIGTGYAYPEHYAIPEMARADRAREILRGEQFRRSLP